MFRLKNNILLNGLVIEDDSEDFIILSETLNDNGNCRIEFTRASTIKEAINLLQEQIFDFIFLDLTLPDSVGMNTVINLKKYSKDTPIFILTGTTLTRDELRTCLESVDSYLVKGHINKTSVIKNILSKIPAYKLHAINARKNIL